MSDLERWQMKCPAGTPVWYWPHGVDDYLETWTTGPVYHFQDKIMVRVDGVRHPVQVCHLRVVVDEIKGGIDEQ